MKQYTLTLICPPDLIVFNQTHFSGKDPSYSIIIDPRFQPACKLAISVQLEEDEAIIKALTLNARIIESL